MSLDNIQVNFLAVIIAAAIYFLLGALWYSPSIFGVSWQKDAGVVSGASHKVFAYIGEFIVDLIIAYVLALFIELVRANEWMEGFLIALWIWIGFIATYQVSGILWGRKTFKSFVINGGFSLVGLLLMSAIIILLKDYRFDIASF